MYHIKRGQATFLKIGGFDKSNPYNFMPVGLINQTPTNFLNLTIEENLWMIL